jgi:hypothetical protein
VSNFELALATASAACNLRTSRISSHYNELRRIDLAPGLISATVVAATWHFWQISLTHQTELWSTLQNQSLTLLEPKPKYSSQTSIVLSSNSRTLA